MKYSILVFLLATTLSACGPDTGNRSVEAISGEGASNADIIRNPVSADGAQDTVNVPRISFAEPVFDFGTANEGDIVTHRFAFTNTGKTPLLISSARASCGCTVPQWPKEPIPPGASGEIFVEFNTTNKYHQQSKPVTIIANTYPAQSKVILKGYVEPSPETAEAIRKARGGTIDLHR